MKDSLVSALVDALVPRLLHRRIQRIHRRAPSGGYRCQLHGRGETVHLLLQTVSPQDRVHVVPGEDAWRVPADSATLLLRQHLVGATVMAITRAVDDRRVTFALARGEDRYRLEIELFGTHGGWALVHGDREVLYAFGPSMRRRGLRGGAQWIVAPGGGAVPPDQAPAIDFDAACQRLHHLEDQRLIDEERNRQARALKAARTRIERGLRAAEEDARAAAAHTDLRHEADLLQTVRGRLPRGAAEARVPDWMAGGAERRIALDPSQPLESEIERRYRRARRLERAGPALEARRRTLLARLDAVNDHAARLRALEESVLRQMARDRLARPRAQANASTQVRRQPWMHFVSSEGLDILVGRGGADNDTLTFRVARGNDLWFHAEDFAGAHVILRVPRGTTPPQRSIEEAALLAAHHSRGREEGVCTVRFTERKHLRKPAGLAPGRVLVSAARALDVRLDPDRLQAIGARSGRDEGT